MFQNPSQNNLCEEEQQENLKTENEDSTNNLAKKNSNFAQFYTEHLKVMRLLSVKSPLSLGVLMFFVEFMDQNNAVVCSSAVLEEYFDKSRATISRAIKVLKEQKIIKTEKLGNINVFLINSEVCWKSWANNKKYALFTATVLLAESEQTQIDTEKEHRVKAGMIKNNAFVKNKENQHLYNNHKQNLKNSNSGEDQSFGDVPF